MGYVRDLLKRAWLFKAPENIQEPVVSPAPGEKWILKCQSSNPFTRDDYTVIIKDVKEGWVLYDMNKDVYTYNLFSKQTKTIRDFTRVYQKREV